MAKGLQPGSDAKLNVVGVKLHPEKGIVVLAHRVLSRSEQATFLPSGLSAVVEDSENLASLQASVRFRRME